MMRLKIALLCALLVPVGTAKADVTSFSKATRTGDPFATTSLFIHFKTANISGAAFSLGKINIRGTAGASTGSLTASLFAASGGASQIGGDITVNTYTPGNDIDLSSFGLFANNPTGGLWLRITGINASKFYQGDGALLGSDNSLAANGAIFVDSASTSTATTTDANMFSVASFTVAVPEPATMILTGSALAAGAIGAYFKRRRKPQTEIAA